MHLPLLEVNRRPINFSFLLSVSCIHSVSFSSWIAAQKVLSLYFWLCKEAVKCFKWNQHVSSRTFDLWCHSLLFVIKDRLQKYFESDFKMLYSDFYRPPKLMLRVLSNTIVSWIFFLFLINNSLMQLKHEQSLIFILCLTVHQTEEEGTSVYLCIELRTENCT